MIDTLQNVDVIAKKDVIHPWGVVLFTKGEKYTLYKNADSSCEKVDEMRWRTVTNCSSEVFVDDYGIENFETIAPIKTFKRKWDLVSEE